MADNLGMMLSLRFVRSRRKGALTRFISFASTCGIAVGVFAAIVGFSAMNGFESELENRVLSVIPSARLTASDSHFKDVEGIESVLKQDKRIQSTAPAAEVRAILSANRAFAPLLITGIDPQAEKEVVEIQRFINVDMNCLKRDEFTSIAGHCSVNTPKAYTTQDTTLAKVNRSAETNTQTNDSNTAKVSDVDNEASIAAAGDSASEQDNGASEQSNSAYDKMPRIIIGSSIAKKLGVGAGDVVTMMVMSNVQQQHDDFKDFESSLKAPNRNKALVIGVIHLGGQLDGSLALMDLDELLTISKLEGPNAIHIRTSVLKDTNRIIYDATYGKISENAMLSTWMNSQGKLYHDIQMVRQIMFIAMFLVLAVACFNIVSNLMMMTSEKRREIAILLTMGMPRSQIVRTFSLMGIITGLYGTLFGLIPGILLSLSLSPITSSWKEWFGFDLLNEDVYFINFIPSDLSFIDVLIVALASLLMSWLAAIYPAMRASRVQPAQELNL
ncbi:MAG: FtsX-like permease family protein [Anaerobiospirillum succiniciproducens]|uniref:FtsX-like permease family protein n=1 Tax=Anaerobiospirillum succiniciproducens TaxID=13335 RepID=UPI002A75B0E9|nr:FtsX-like permease family protein [Anaerobiospirillum succiniciproducens]MDY2798700.1 FtsX-like permease family protein [Anaerobiospirillum succiniciproducens]